MLFSITNLHLPLFTMNIGSDISGYDLGHGGATIDSQSALSFCFMVFVRFLEALKYFTDLCAVSFPFSWLFVCVFVYSWM